MSRESRLRLPLSVIIGAVVVPVTAVLAVMIFQGDAPAGASVEPSSTTSVAVTAPAGTTPSLAEDLAMACGPAGEKLAQLERSGSATDIQSAALDALRPICDSLGVKLSYPATERTAALEAAAAPSASQATTVANRSSDENEIEMESDDEHEIESHEEHEREYEYEDGEWEADD